MQINTELWQRMVEANGIDIQLLAILYARTKSGRALRFNYRELQGILGVSWSTVSLHLNRLHRSGFIDYDPEISGWKISASALEFIND